MDDDERRATTTLLGWAALIAGAVILVRAAGLAQPRSFIFAAALAALLLAARSDALLHELSEMSDLKYLLLEGPLRHVVLLAYWLLSIVSLYAVDALFNFAERAVSAA
ncbi:MAG: hypothetical protein KC616_25690 [Myxococcales bacterium]|nr:hypothetical protein [Myxococcales bacterium]